jgi:hypothetical protein
MPQTNCYELRGTHILLLDARGAALRGSTDAEGCIAEALSQATGWVVIPTDRLEPDIFRQRTGVAGDIVQEFAAYRLGLAIVSDAVEQTALGQSWRNFVNESNRGRQAWFFKRVEEFEERLESQA